MTATKTASKYDQVTKTIIAKLEEGIVPWQKPWNVQVPTNARTGYQYRGLNTLILGLVGETPFWLTMKQIKAICDPANKKFRTEQGDKWKKLRGKEKYPYGLNKGAKSEIVFFWKWMETEEEDDNGKAKMKRWPMLRTYLVFNVANCTMPPGWEPKGKVVLKRFNKLRKAEQIIQAENLPVVKHDGGNRAYYRPTDDSIHLPNKGAFASPEHYYGTKFHELAHSTGHESRLNRDLSGMFGDEGYSKEELVAELTSAFLLADCGMQLTIDNHAAYIQSWLQALKNDRKMIVFAAAQAQKAADYLKNETTTRSDQ